MQEAVTRMPKPLDREKWHRPLVSIIVTHHNYSAHLEDCLRSILDQTHENWECVVVDDCSDADHRETARRIIDEIGSPKMRLLALSENVGQIPAFYAGLDATKGPFACLLDPDDRYAETFLAEMIAAHCNPIRYGALVSCEQFLLQGDQVVTGVQTAHMARLKLGDAAPGEWIGPDLRFIPADAPGWHWSTTSGMMFRRDALEAMRPRRKLGYRGDADAYLAPGAHALGSSMFLAKALMYRGVHADNDWLRRDVIGMLQVPKRAVVGKARRADALEAIIANGYEADLARAKRGKRTMSQRLRRSFAKRLHRWASLTREERRKSVIQPAVLLLSFLVLTGLLYLLAEAMR